MKTENGFRISFEEAIEAAHHILRRFGRDYTYKACPEMGCAYVHHVITVASGEPRKESAPGCIVGQILFRLGVALEDLKDYGSLTEYMRGCLLREKNIELTDRAFDFLTMAQFFQDRGINGAPPVTWGAAVDYAESITDRYRYTRLTERRVPWDHDTSDCIGD